MKSIPFRWTALGVALASLSMLACSSDEPAAPPSGEANAPHGAGAKTVTGGVPFHGLLEYRAKDAKLALVRPTLVSAGEAALAGGVSVVGVSVGKESRAYPLYVLKNHQIVNDRVGGQPIAASW